MTMTFGQFFAVRTLKFTALAMAAGVLAALTHGVAMSTGTFLVVSLAMGLVTNAAVPPNRFPRPR